MVIKLLTDVEVKIAEKEVLRYQGYPRAKTPEGEIVETLASEIEEGYRLIEPKAIYSEIKRLEVAHNQIILENNLVLNAEKAVKEWQDLQILGVALCTIGIELERKVSELFALGEYPAALMLDSVGSAAVESLVDHVNYHICHRARKTGMIVGPRLSPGYGKWGLQDQKVLFSLLPAENIGVRLNEQCMMIPRKSVSFCVGMGREIKVKKPCRYCGLEDCPYRTG